VESNPERCRLPGSGEAVRGAVSVGVCLIKYSTLRRLGIGSDVWHLQTFYDSIALSRFAIHSAFYFSLL
jgi:hypothetical protein